jgi:hypothetical protein
MFSTLSVFIWSTFDEALLNITIFKAGSAAFTEEEDHRP